MKTEKNTISNTISCKFGFVKDDEYYTIETDKEIKTFAKKHNIDTNLMELIIENYNRLAEYVDADLCDIWERLNNIEGK